MEHYTNASQAVGSPRLRNSCGCLVDNIDIAVQCSTSILVSLCSPLHGRPSPPQCVACRFEGMGKHQRCVLRRALRRHLGADRGQSWRVQLHALRCDGGTLPCERRGPVHHPGLRQPTLRGMPAWSLPVHACCSRRVLNVRTRHSVFLKSPILLGPASSVCVIQRTVNASSSTPPIPSTIVSRMPPCVRTLKPNTFYADGVALVAVHTH